MLVAESKLWKLAYPELAKLCLEITNAASNDVRPQLRDEARRLYGGWRDGLSIDLHQEGAPARQAGILLALRRRTIELALRAHQVTK